MSELDVWLDFQLWEWELEEYWTEHDERIRAR